MLRAYDLGHGQPLEQARRKRQWMIDTPNRFANLCLPLVIACETGWWVQARDNVEATWDGGQSPSSLQVSGVGATSHFGSGIVTFHVDYLFRTEPDEQLFVTGPLNWPKDGAHALSGIVETEWAVATFTMNWLLTRPGVVAWERGEPICQVIPIQMRTAEQPLERSPLGAGETAEQYAQWSRSRSLVIPTAERQLHYQKGTSPGGASCPVGAHRKHVERRAVVESTESAP